MQAAQSLITHSVILSLTLPPMHPPSLQRSQMMPKMLLSAHGLVFINSLNFICSNLVHHLLGMLYKENEKCIAVWMHDRIQINMDREITSGLAYVMACQQGDTHLSIIKGLFEGGWEECKDEHFYSAVYLKHLTCSDQHIHATHLTCWHDVC